MRDEITRRVISTLARELGTGEDKIKPTDDLKEDLGADSAILIVMVMELEGEFGIEVDPDKLADIRTVNDIVDLIEAVKA